MKNLLPPNATEYEVAVAEINGVISDLDVPIRDVWNPDRCPEQLLPWLAWGLSVDFWNDAWPEERKREVIKRSIEIHRHKGTPWAVEEYCRAVGLEAVVEEWFQYNGVPGKFKVAVDAADGFAEAAYPDLYGAVNAAKNTRSHLEAVQISARYEGAAKAAGIALVGMPLTARITIEVDVVQTPAKAAGLARMASPVKGRLPDAAIVADPVPAYSTGVARMLKPLTVGV